MSLTQHSNRPLPAGEQPAAGNQEQINPSFIEALPSGGIAGLLERLGIDEGSADKIISACAGLTAEQFRLASACLENFLGGDAQRRPHEFDPPKMTAYQSKLEHEIGIFSGELGRAAVNSVFRPLFDDLRRRTTIFPGESVADIENRTLITAEQLADDLEPLEGLDHLEEQLINLRFGRDGLGPRGRLESRFQLNMTAAYYEETERSAVERLNKQGVNLSRLLPAATAAYIGNLDEDSRTVIDASFGLETNQVKPKEVYIGEVANAIRRRHLSIEDLSLIDSGRDLKQYNTERFKTEWYTLRGRVRRLEIEALKTVQAACLAAKGLEPPPERVLSFLRNMGLNDRLRVSAPLQIAVASMIYGWGCPVHSQAEIARRLGATEALVVASQRSFWETLAEEVEYKSLDELHMTCYEFVDNCPDEAEQDRTFDFCVSLTKQIN